MILPTSLVPVTLPESSTNQAHRLSLLLSYRILYTAVSFGLTLGSDVSAKDIGVSRTSFTFNQHYNFNLRVHTQLRSQWAEYKPIHPLSLDWT